MYMYARENRRSWPYIQCRTSDASIQRRSRLLPYLLDAVFSVCVLSCLCLYRWILEGDDEAKREKEEAHIPLEIVRSAHRKVCSGTVVTSASPARRPRSSSVARSLPVVGSAGSGGSQVRCVFVTVRQPSMRMFEASTTHVE